MTKRKKHPPISEIVKAIYAAETELQRIFEIVSRINGLKGGHDLILALSDLVRARHEILMSKGSRP